MTDVIQIDYKRRPIQPARFERLAAIVLVHLAENAACCNDFCTATDFYRRALLHAENYSGSGSGLAGWVLWNWADFCDSTGQSQEASQLRRRFNDLLYELLEAFFQEPTSY